MVASEKFLWPKFPLKRPYRKNSRFFKFKNKATYVDFPNPAIQQIYHEILERCDGIPDKVLALIVLKKLFKKKIASSMEYSRGGLPPQGRI